MYVDTMYYGYFNQLPSINQLAQMNNLLVIDAGAFRINMPPVSIILVFDIPVTILLFNELKKRVKKYHIHIMPLISKNLKIAGMTVLAIAIFFAIDPFNVDTAKAINHNELVTYHIYDFYTKFFGEKNNQVDSEEQVDKVLDLYTNHNGKSDYYGMGKGKNLIVIQVESLQNFTINREYNGQVLTPNINKLLNEGTIYFNNYYQTIGKGNTSDAEFSTQNSLYPVIENGSYNLFYDNTFYGLPWIMRENGYKTKAFHGYEGHFWNREKAYPNQGFEDFISLEDFELTNKISFGLADKDMFEQTLEHLEVMKQPYYSFIVTLSCHYPYNMPEHVRDELTLEEQDENTLFGNYIQAAHYSDKAIGYFIDELKKRGMYDNTIIAMYGDHHGLKYNKPGVYERMTEYLGYSYDYDEMLNIPMLIHIPGVNKSETIEVVGGQVDFLPTIADVMGVDINNKFIMGQNLLTATKGFVASVTYMLRGSFITDDVLFEISRESIFEGSRVWDFKTRNQLELTEEYGNNYIRALNLLDASKYILENDLIKRQ
jgi:phosphoglycerol transferase MdoB-like AlkP superfamily enzyme